MYFKNIHNVIVIILCTIVSFPVFAQDEIEEGVCAKVRIRIVQEAVISRVAFQATLEIINSPENVSLSNLQVDLDIRNGENEPSNQLFEIHSPKLEGIDAIDGSGVLPPGNTGKIDWVFIPSHEAAENGPTRYQVGGSILYKENGQDIVLPLYPDGIWVMPSPRLYVDYFLERDVFGDDPFTEDVIEPPVPFSLGIRVSNLGQGEAENLKIISSQPEIIENEKGLLIDFKIIGTQVGAETISPSLTAEFGSIPPGEATVARWQMVSSLQGKFLESSVSFERYSARFEHTDPIGDVHFSLFEQAKTHELIHVVRMDAVEDDMLPDFLVNDATDDKYPDTIYSSDGSMHPVNISSDNKIVVNSNSNSKQVKIDCIVPDGWVYIQVEDPIETNFNLVKAVRSDGKEICLIENIWRTNRVKRLKGQDPKKDNKLHLVDYNSTGKYDIYYEIDETFTPTTTPNQTPESTLTPLPTDTSNPTMTPTPIGVVTQKPTEIPTPLSISSAQLNQIYEFEKINLSDNGWSEIPGGFQPNTPAGVVSTANLEAAGISSSRDNRGLRIDVEPGQVSFLFAHQSIPALGKPVLLRLCPKASGPNAHIALVGLKGDVRTQVDLDGSIATHIPANSIHFVDAEKTLVLLYQPDADKSITPAIQIAATTNSASSTTVWIDRLEIFIVEDALYSNQIGRFDPLPTPTALPVHSITLPLPGR